MFACVCVCGLERIKLPDELGIKRVHLEREWYTPFLLLFSLPI